jgi:hypothetical protein
MNVEDLISAALRSRVQSVFGLAYPGVPMFFDNEDFKMPTTSYIEVIINPVATRRENIGDSRKFCKHGTVNIKCFMPEGKGTRTLSLYTDALEAGLLDKQIAIPGNGHITLFGSESRNRGSLNGFYLRTLQFAYRATVVLPA